MIPQVPELADGGYWYVADSVAVTDDTPGYVPPGSAGPGRTVTYAEIGGTVYCVIRSPDPLLGVPGTDIDSNAVLDAAGFDAKPYGRIGGR